MKVSHPFQQDVPSILRTIRERKGMSQEQIANAIGCTFMNVSHKELGRRKISLIELEKWANALGYEVAISLIPLK